MIDMEHEILDLIDRYWKFDDNQTPVSNWHDKQDLLEAVRKALRIHDVSGQLPDFLYEDEGQIKIGYHGDTVVTDEWNKWKEGNCG